jgi:hypothetical protein
MIRQAAQERRVDGDLFLVLGSWFLVLGSWFLVLGAWWMVLGGWWMDVARFLSLAPTSAVGPEEKHAGTDTLCHQRAPTGRPEIA